MPRSASSSAPTSARLSVKPSGSRFAFIFRHVDPLDLTVEAIYTVLIVLTFTLAVNVFDERNALGFFLNEDVLSGLFLAAFGCAVAWGLIDGVMYIFTCLAERGQENRMLRVIQEAPTREEGIQRVNESLEETLPFTLDDETRAGFEAFLYREIADSEPKRIRLQKDDLLGALLVFLAAVIVSLPIVLPLVFVSTNAFVAIRLSNLIAFAMLYYLGFRWARYTGGVPWSTGLMLLTVGVFIVAVAIPLGG